MGKASYQPNAAILQSKAMNDVNIFVNKSDMTSDSD